MAVLLPEQIPPLAYDANGENFAVPERAVGWRATRANGKPGRPRLVITEHGPLHLGFETSYEQFCEAVKHEPGDYRLYPVDSCGKMLEPVAYVEISEKHQSPESQMLAHREEQSLRAPGSAWGGGAPKQMFDFCKQMLTSRDAHDALMAEMMSTMVKQVALMQDNAMKQTAAMQVSMAGLLTAATQTIKVANGVEALERPELNIEELSDKLRNALGPVAAQGKPATPWYEALLGSPMGAMLIQFVSNFAMGVQQAAQAQALASAPDERQAAPAQECLQPAQARAEPSMEEDEENAPRSGGNSPPADEHDPEDGMSGEPPEPGQTPTVEKPALPGIKNERIPISQSEAATIDPLKKSPQPAEPKKRKKRKRRRPRRRRT